MKKAISALLALALCLGLCIPASLGLEPEFINFTKPENRQAEYRFQADDLLVMASPLQEFGGGAVLLQRGVVGADLAPVQRQRGQGVPGQLGDRTE